MSQEKLKALRDSLNRHFPERREVIDGTLAALLTGEHILLLGPPGTAKSALARAVAQVFGGSYFERLLTKFSTPEELFGPVSLKALEQDKFERVINGKLPTAQIAFLDEIFKANSAILNSLLTLINERVYHNDGQVVPCPLVTVFGASNELPEGKELEALYDRFILRFNVDYILRPTSFKAMLVAKDPVDEVLNEVTLSMPDLAKAQAEVRKVKVPDATIDCLTNIRDDLKAEGFIASDRRWKKSIKLVQAMAYLAGEKETSPEDLSVLSDSLWREPKERSKLAAIVGRLSDPTTAKVTEILDAARESMGKLSQVKAQDRQGFIQVASKLLQDFQQQAKALDNLALSAGPRAKATAESGREEIASLHEELAKRLAQGLNLGIMDRRGPK